MRIIALILACCGSLLAQTDNPAYDQSADAGRVVGKPYSAAEVTHSTQTLTNGSHIDRTITDLVWQDEQGRLRTEMRDDRQRVVIQDSVAMVVYIVDLVNKTVRKSQLRPVTALKPAGDVSPVEEAREWVRWSSNHQVEDLGSQVINGVQALGVRVTTTIPVGAIGNDQELKSVTERWYSNEIHALVKTVTTDPRTGVHTYELTNIVRSQPDPSLFQVPPGFTVMTIQSPSIPSPAKK